MNRQIRAREVRLIDDEGNQLGIVEIREAQKIADERGLDLVEVAPNANPPVCRVMDFGKFLYQEKKRAQEAKK
ncbi:MAG TPA: translation initiation factor IF-3, partial [Thermoanaerobaculia bacterium]|nr:translation initiation factor IF-3 [Thermoanaerobaculia bacterium]